ncbi:MAG: hypothetical protein LBT68_02635, partial [Spirochaetales bacterium]|nr:hypothetical protein [Spirochaetales bacterium]
MRKRILPAFLIVSAIITAAVMLSPCPAAAGGNSDEGASADGDGEAGPAPAEELPGERETLALAQAYPGRVAERALRGGDWALRVGEDWYAWAQGRMLPEAEKDHWNEFIGLRFYKYSHGLPPLPQLDEEAKTRLRERLAADREKPPVR